MSPEVVAVRLSMNPRRIFGQANTIDRLPVMVTTTRPQNRRNAAMFLSDAINSRQLTETLPPEPSTRLRR
jgi:hypothetical protein